MWFLRSPDPLLEILFGAADENAYVLGLFNFLSAIILFQVMIPIAVYITLDIVNLVQVYFINTDIRLYHAETDTKMNCRSFNIHSDLGQINYIFTDKTGK